MSETPGYRRVLQLARTNWLSATGGAITTLSFFAFVTFFFLTVVGAFGGPYLGLLTFLVLPGLFVTGLILIPIGLFLYRKHIRDRLEAVRAKPLNVIRAVSILTIINVLVVGVAGYQGIHYMESVEFCGTLCHEVMHPTYIAYQDSAHARVGCVDCHIGPGASWFVKSKLSGLRQVLAVTFDTFDRPVPVPIRDLRPARETCEQCHWPDKFAGDTLVRRAHFGYDRENTPHYNLLVMKTGGIRSDGKASGIHWHVHEGNEVTYVAADRKRSEIPWVRFVDHATGEERIYTAPGVDPARPPAGESRRMDCVDCHNQPSHHYDRSFEALNRALGDDRISPRLPFIKKLGRETLEAEYPVGGEADGIRARIEAFYREEEPLPAELRPLVEPAILALLSIRERNVHPAMKIGWDTYRSYQGHYGCLRCHDGQHRTSEGLEIPLDCESCHVILGYRSLSPELRNESDR